MSETQPTRQPRQGTPRFDLGQFLYGKPTPQRKLAAIAKRAPQAQPQQQQAPPEPAERAQAQVEPETEAEPTRTRLLLDDYRQRVLAAAFWRGQAGLSERAVLLAMQEVAYQANSLIFSASVRQLAEGASRGRTATCGAIGRLVARRLVERPELPDGQERARDKAATYRLALDSPLLRTDEDTSGSGAGHGALGAVCTDADTNAGQGPPSPLRHGTVRIGAHPVWDDDGLGRAALLVWEALRRIEPATTAELVRATGLARRTVQKHRRHLAEHKLALTNGYLWVAAERDLDELAAELGAGKLRQRRQQQHQREREGHQLHLARQAEQQQAQAPPQRRPQPRPHQVDVLAATRAAGAQQLDAAAGRRKAPLSKRRAVCQGVRVHLHMSFGVRLHV
jgi:hypothetical protein